MTQGTDRTPRFNHVAMSMPADSLGEEGRTDIIRFYGDVFGWNELDMLTEDRHRLVLQAYDYEQFVFLIAEDDPMSCPRLDHFGMSVGSLDELLAFEQKVKDYAAEDDRVDLIERQVEDHDGFLDLHSFYVRYLLPMMIEVQYFDWKQR